MKSKVFCECFFQVYSWKGGHLIDTERVSGINPIYISVKSKKRRERFPCEEQRFYLTLYFFTGRTVEEGTGKGGRVKGG